MNIIDCLLKTYNHWISNSDFYPFTLQSIINNYRKQLTLNETYLIQKNINDTFKKIFTSEELEWIRTITNESSK